MSKKVIVSISSIHFFILFFVDQNISSSRICGHLIISIGPWLFAFFSLGAKFCQDPLSETWANFSIVLLQILVLHFYYYVLGAPFRLWVSTSFTRHNSATCPFLLWLGTMHLLFAQLCYMLLLWV
jgi:hypothetical protein